ncbi:branched-chain amino acid aminotransferase II [Xylona heveae TC161]|uniref:Branched-chain-amino-acid aminotransferase n=1 Tax=Xylona heveae (strain CBS 132557 / TC161) TaxID=1328760 RepID=A0A165J2X3_XYLHT|nr:branched-chain amino acid aminotransferase II [Xylona heveae TC161]KZF25656.1 branched-chain amino acid aminotransferase II [Xylona heveae TC161]
MSPSAVQQPESITELNSAAVAQNIAQTAPSIAPASATPASTLPELDASQLRKNLSAAPRAVPDRNSPEVWSMSTCTDHMVTVRWTADNGWEAPELKPYGPLSLMPTASCLHYATECFEGMKVYRGYDGKLRLFRPDKNCERMVLSSARIALPAFDPRELQKLVEALVEQDGSKWLPVSQPGQFLYIRPTMIANAPALGVQRPREALLYVILCLFPSFDEPTGTQAPVPGQTLKKPGLKLLASQDDMVRAWPGGFGFAKVGANYGPSLIAQNEAKQRGYDQILWLFGSNAEVTEAGASNFFVVWRTRDGALQLVTAPLQDKIILDGVTRRSVLQLARERLTKTWEGDGIKIEGLEIVERKFTMSEVDEAIAEGRLVEAFAAGTAFFIAPVSEIHFRGKDLDIPLAAGTTGHYAALLKNWLRNIMYGKERHEWGVVVEETA